MVAYLILAIIIAAAFTLGYWWRGRQDIAEDLPCLVWQPLAYEPINMELFHKLPEDEQVRFARDYFARPDGIITMQKGEA